MSVFQLAYQLTMGNEGGYANNKDDHGGETWRGVARNFWPKWPGWPIVDNIKAKHPANLNKELNSSIPLQDLTYQFYKTNFWDCLNLDHLNDQQISNQLFDISVNMGSGIAARFLQEAINQDGDFNITVDGVAGKITTMAANKFNPVILYNRINALRIARYNHIIANDPSQMKFKSSWFSRIKNYHTSDPDQTTA